MISFINRCQYLVASAVFGIAALFSPHGVMAQAVQTDGTGKATSSDELVEVVVTAERRSSDIQTTPISLTAISGAQLADKHIDGLNTLEQTAPSLTFNASGFTQLVNIRGIGVGSSTPAIVPGVAIMYDGLFQGETIGLNVPFYDIADTEVLRGPQGTFVGQSSTGGAVLINSANPNFDGTNGYAEAQLGDYNERKVTGAVNLPITDTLAARIAFNAERRHSFYKDIGPGAPDVPGTSVIPTSSDPGHVDKQNIRLGLLWKPGDSFQALFKAELNNSDSGGFPGVADQNAPHQYSQYYAYTTHQPYLLNFNTPGLSDVETVDRYSLELKYTLPDGILLRSLTGLQHFNTSFNWDYDGSSANGIAYRQDVGPKNNYYTQEFNVISPNSGPLTWIGGTSFFYRKTPVVFEQDVGTPPFSPDNLQTVNTDGIITTVRSVGLFGQVSYQLVESLQLQLGVRDNYDNFFNRGGFSIKIPLPPTDPLTVFVPASGHYQDNVPTAKIGLNWTPLDGQFIYAFAARGYKSGGVNGPDANFKPEHVNDYELGWKGRLFDDHLATQIGGFLMNYQAMQQQLVSPLTGTNAVANLGNSKIQGIEASAQARFLGFDVDGSLAYTDSKLGSVTAIETYRLPGQAAVNLGPQCPPGVAMPTCFDYGPFTTSLSGEQNPYSPKLIFNAGIDYGIALGNGTLKPRVNFSHTDKQYASIFQTDGFYLLGARNLLGATLTYESGPWLAQIYGTNLTNEIYTSGLNGLGNLQYYGDPRQAGFRARRNF